MKMSALKIFIITILLLGCACGSGSDETSEVSSGSDESDRLNCFQLQYLIKIDDIPLTGPQSEEYTLLLADNFSRYDGVLEVMVGDDITQMERSTYLRFRDTSQVFLYSVDNSYDIKIYAPQSLFDSSADQDSDFSNRPVSRLRFTKTEQFENIGDFGECQKWLVRTKTQKTRYGQAVDSTPTLSGEIWIREESSASSQAIRYYSKISEYLGDDTFDGIELWRVLKKLDIPVQDLKQILDNLNGLIVKADLSCKRYSLGRKAKISVFMNLSDMHEERVASELFGIPDEYNPATRRETAN